MSKINKYDYFGCELGYLRHHFSQQKGLSKRKVIVNGSNDVTVYFDEEGNIHIDSIYTENHKKEDPIKEHIDPPLPEPSEEFIDSMSGRKSMIMNKIIGGGNTTQRRPSDSQYDVPIHTKGPDYDYDAFLRHCIDCAERRKEMSNDPANMNVDLDALCRAADNLPEIDRHIYPPRPYDKVDFFMEMMASASRCGLGSHKKIVKAILSTKSFRKEIKKQLKKRDKKKGNTLATVKKENMLYDYGSVRLDYPIEEARKDPKAFNNRVTELMIPHRYRGWEVEGFCVDESGENFQAIATRRPHQISYKKGN